MTRQLLTEFEKLAREAHRFHPGEWKDCKYRFCRERFVMLQAALSSIEASQYIAGMRLGWNCAITGDEEAFDRAIQSAKLTASTRPHAEAKEEPFILAEN